MAIEQIVGITYDLCMFARMFYTGTFISKDQGQKQLSNASSDCKAFL